MDILDIFIVPNLANFGDYDFTLVKAVAPILYSLSSPTTDRWQLRLIIYDLPLAFSVE
jgi:hypothetical protein